MVAIVGFGGKSTVVERLAAEEPALTLHELHGEPLPGEATALVIVAGIDVMGEPPALSKTAERLATELVGLAAQWPSGRAAYVLNKADDELRLQQAKQVSALLRRTTAITVDGYVIWPDDNEPRPSPSESA